MKYTKLPNSKTRIEITGTRRHLRKRSPPVHCAREDIPEEDEGARVSPLKGVKIGDAELVICPEIIDGRTQTVFTKRKFSKTDRHG